MCVSVKKRRNWHRHDYSEIDDGSKVKILNLLTVEVSYAAFFINSVFLLCQAVQAGTVAFIKELKTRKFK